jgi:predicted nucleotidyltransferase
MEEGWTTISPKKKEKNINQKNQLKFNDIINIVNNILLKYKPEYIFIYGSRARNTNKINSDVDIMVFWKYPIFNYDKLCFIKDELKNELNLNVDFACMHLTNKFVKVYDERTICYYENVCLDAKCIYFAKTNRDIHDLIDYSIKLQKIE